MSKPQITPQVPGESPAPSVTQAAAEQDQTGQQAEQAQASDAPPATAEAKPAAKATAGRGTKKSQASDGTAGELPDQDDIDPTKIKRSVLTKQGWVCPATAEA